MSSPMLNYKPGLTMDEPVPVMLAAADWNAFMVWISQDHVPTDGIGHIVNIMAQQIKDALYTKASQQAARAYIAERMQQQFPFAVPMMQTMPRPDDFKIPHYADASEVWTIQCGECGSQDEYGERYLGPLTCGHDGPREVLSITMVPQKEGENED